MARNGKLYSQLDQLEAELKSRLVSAARTAAMGANDLLFVVSDLNPFPRSVRTPDETVALVALGQDTLKLRAKLGESVEAAPATLFRRYCERWSDISDHHRGTCASLARQLLVD